MGDIEKGVFHQKINAARHCTTCFVFNPPLTWRVPRIKPFVAFFIIESLFATTHERHFGQYLAKTSVSTGSV